MSSLPIFKLVSLLAKQLAKPLAIALKAKATTHPNLKNYVVLPTANGYHNLHFTIRMKILGVGGKIPPLTEKAAIELGGNILAEFFVFGTAIAIIIIELVRSGRKQVFKETTVANRVSSLEANTHILLETVEAYNTRFVEMNTVIATQKSKIDDLINQINILDSKLNQKLAVQETHTTKSSWQLGKLFQSKTLSSPSRINQASSDVTTSKLYQIAEETAAMLMPFKKSKDPVTEEPVIKPYKSKTAILERFFSSFLRY